MAEKNSKKTKIPKMIEFDEDVVEKIDNDRGLFFFGPYVNAVMKGITKPEADKIIAKVQAEA